MNTQRSRFWRPVCALALLGSALGFSSALAAGNKNADPSDAQARYQRDAAVCQSSRYVGDRAECMNAASAARISREPVSVDPDPGRYARNALKRCEPLPEADRGDCVARIQGLGTTSGSVAAGGILRELVRREIPAQPETPAPTK